MPDQKISDLAAGDPLQPTDELVVARAGSNFKIDGSAVVAAVTKHDVTLAGNTAGALALVSSGTLTLAGGNNITLSQAGNAVTISAPTQSVQPETQTFIGGISASDTLYTSGTVRITGVGGGVTVSSNTGQRVDISVAAQSVQTQNVHNVTLSGNTAGALAEISSGTLTLAGGNNITISQAGNAITISGANVGGAQTGISGIANSQTTYTSGTVSLSELGAITIRSTTGQQFQFSVNPQSVQPETQTFIGGISASDTLYTSGTVRFTGVGGGVTVSTNTGQRVDISVAAQSVQPETQTFVGGIGNSQTTYTSGTVNLSVVAGNLTIRSTTGQAFQFSMSQTVQPETQTAISGIANSQTTYTSGTVSLSELGAITIRSTTGNQFQFSVNSQTAQTGISGVANSQTTYTSGTVSLSELGAITIRSTTGNQYQFSVNSQTVQTQGILSAGVSTGGNTAGNTTVNTGSRFVIVASGNATASQATAAGASTVTISVGTQTAQTQGIINAGVSTGGNTSGDTTVNSGTRLVFVGTNNVTLSQGTAANATTITISGPTTAAQSVQTQGILNVALSNVGNTAGDTGINSGTRYVLAGGNNITLSGSTAANATTVTISAASQSVQTQGILSAGVSTGGNTAGNTTVNTGSRMVYVGSNMVSLSQGTAAGATTITFNATQSVQTNDIPRLGVSTGGNTAGDTTVNSGTRFVLVGTNMVSLSQATAASATTISINATNQNLSAGVSNVGNTSGDTTVNTGSRLVFAGGNNITLSQGTAAGATTITISAPNLGAGAFSGGVSTGGNTAGDTGITGTQGVFVGVSPISLSQATGANGGTISILAPATSSWSATGIVSLSTNGSTVSVGAPAFSGGMSTNGNTAGDTGYASQRINLVGSNNITLSGSTNGGSMSISIIGGGGGGFSAGVSTGGNTAGATGITGTQLVLVGGSNISLSQTTGANGGTVSVNAPASSSLSATGAVSISVNDSTISIGVPRSNLYDWQNMPLADATLMTHVASISKTPFYWNDIIPGNITAKSLVWRGSMVTASQPLSLSVHLGIYTFANSTSANLLGSVSEAFVVSSASSVSLSGIRNWVISGIGTHTALSTLSGGEYMFGMMFSATATNAMNLSLMGAGSAGGPLGVIYPGTNQLSTGTSQGIQALHGRGSTTVNAMPSAVSAADLVNQGQGASMQLQPWIYIRS